jgi:14-3-3 protein epsilon
MQLLRDNLTLWTSSDGGDGEAAASGEASKEEKPAETAAAPAEPAAEKTDAPAAS